MFGSLPRGLNQDEAFAGYEAFALLNWGIDSAGYPFPVYLTAWGSGMNALETYLAMPFIALLGNTATAIRLPMLLTGIVCLPVFYLLCKKLTDEKTAVLGLFILAVCPWHIMLCRWALESNLAPGFMLIGLYFFVKGVENSKYLPLSALFYGLSLYGYSITWVAVPLTLFLWGIYLLLCRKLPKVKSIALSRLVMAVFALPLILFLAMNFDLIPEITTPFLSIPKMLYMRSGEISPKNLLSPNSYINLIKLIITENDGLIWNNSQPYGMFYKISLPFMIVGLCKTAFGFIKSVKSKTYNSSSLIFLGYIGSFITCLMLGTVNINRTNCLHFYSLLMTVYGIEFLISVSKNRKTAFAAILVTYSICFGLFRQYYFTDYNSRIEGVFRSGVQQSLDCLKEKGYEKISVADDIFHPQIMYFDGTDVNSYRRTVEYRHYPDRFLKTTAFTNFIFKNEFDYTEPARIIPAHLSPDFSANGYTVENFGRYCAAYK